MELGFDSVVSDGSGRTCLDMEMVAPLSNRDTSNEPRSRFDGIVVSGSGYGNGCPFVKTATPRDRYEMVRKCKYVWVGRFRFLCCVAVLDVVATSLEGGGPTLPLWGRVVT